MNFSGVITVYFFAISMLCHVEVTFIQLLNLLRGYYVYYIMYLLSLVIKSYKLLINFCIYLYIRLLNNMLIVKKYTVITPEKFVHKFYYYVLIFIEFYFSNFRPITCFSVMLPDAV